MKEQIEKIIAEYHFLPPNTAHQSFSKKAG
jgi:hypothetical protein